MPPSWIRARFPDATLTPVTAGWSDDLKLRIATPAATHLLRVSPLDTLARKQDEFFQLQRLNRQTDAFPRALDCGVSPDGTQAYLLYDWVPGTDAIDVLPRLSADAQFQLGCEAGRLLKLIHAQPQDKVVDAHDYVTKKVALRRQQMRDAKLTFDGYDAMLAFLDAHLPLLRDTPTVYHHGDFHPGNMLVDDAGRLRVIDFNRSDFGDPVEDFNRLFTFGRQASLPFARGQLTGYFGTPPDAFFQHALCYILIDCAFGILWAQRFGPRELAVQHALIAQIMTDFDQLRTTRPVWF